jgi:excisionase family DNA binding protein
MKMPLTDKPSHKTEPSLAQPLLSAAEVDALLRVPRSTLYELVRSRGLPHVRVGDRGLRFTLPDLEQWIEENTYGTRRHR